MRHDDPDRAVGQSASETRSGAHRRGAAATAWLTQIALCIGQLVRRVVPPTCRRVPRPWPWALSTQHAADAERADKDWALFTRRFRKEMAAPDAARTLDVLLALSLSANLRWGVIARMSAVAIARSCAPCWPSVGRRSVERVTAQRQMLSNQ